MTTSCINLLERFGDIYRITYDEAYDPTHVPRARRDPWYMQIPCERGVIYPQGGDLLAVEVNYHPVVRGRGKLRVSGHEVLRVQTGSSCRP